MKLADGSVLILIMSENDIQIVPNSETWIISGACVRKPNIALNEATNTRFTHLNTNLSFI